MPDYVFDIKRPIPLMPSHKTAEEVAQESWLPTGIRVGSGLVGSAVSTGGPLGMLFGGLIGGAGEGVAQLAEGNNPLTGTGLARMGVEAGLTAIPLNKIYQGGKFGASVLRGAGLGATGAVGRQVAAGGDIDFTSTYVPTLLGGATGGAMGLAAQRMGVKAFQDPPVAASPVAPTTPPTSSDLLAKLLGTKTPQEIEAAALRVHALGNPDMANDIRRVAVEIGQSTPVTAQRYIQSQERMLADRAKNQQSSNQTARAQNVAQEQAIKLQKEAAAKRTILGTRAGMEEQPPVIRQTIGAEIPGGKLQRTRTWTMPEKKDADVMVPSTPPVSTSMPVIGPREAQAQAALPSVRSLEALEEQLGRPITPPKGGMGTIPSPVASHPPTEPFNPVIPPEGLAKLFRTRTAALGQGYDAAQAAEKAGMQAKDPLGILEGTSFKSPARILGTGLQREAKAAGLPTRGSAPVGPIAAPQTPPTPQSYNLKDMLTRVMAERRPGTPSPIGPSSGGGSSWSGQGGFIAPTLAARAGLGAAGALTGAALDEEDRQRGALIGGTAGILAPEMIRGAKQLPAAGAAIKAGFQSPDAFRELGEKIGSRVPEVIRANYLASAPGQIANTIVGPWAAGITGGLEEGLAGDPRGWEVIRQMSPVKLFPRVPQAYNEAQDMIGRAEGRSMNQAVTDFDRLTAGPGTLMTTGDQTVRGGIKAAGYSEDAARNMTNTEEPTSKFGKKLVNLQRGGGWLGQTTLPFIKTPVNLMENGAVRLPGAGALYQFFKKGADRSPEGLRRIAAEQAVSTGTGLGAYAIGNNLDPESAKMARRFVTNAGGRNALTAGISFAVGQANRQDNDLSNAVLTGAKNSIPLPTTDTLEDFWDWGTNSFDPAKLPRAVAPDFVRDYIVPEPSAFGEVPDFTFKLKRTF